LPQTAHAVCSGRRYVHGSVLLLWRDRSECPEFAAEVGWQVGVIPGVKRFA